MSPKIDSAIIHTSLQPSHTKNTMVLTYCKRLQQLSYLSTSNEWSVTQHFSCGIYCLKSAFSSTFGWGLFTLVIACPFVNFAPDLFQRNSATESCQTSTTLRIILRPTISTCEMTKFLENIRLVLKRWTYWERKWHIASALRVWISLTIARNSERNMLGFAKIDSGEC